MLAENARLTTELADLKAAQRKLKEEDCALSQQIVTSHRRRLRLAERAAKGRRRSLKI